MNERICGLWEQSTGASVPADGFYSSASAFNIEKFAELIVRECISALDEAGGSIHHSECLLEHFGVEQ